MSEQTMQDKLRLIADAIDQNKYVQAKLRPGKGWEGSQMASGFLNQVMVLKNIEYRIEPDEVKEEELPTEFPQEVAASAERVIDEN